MLAMDLLHRLRVATRAAKQMAVDCMKARPGIEVASLSDVGCLRDNNEDSYLYWEPSDDLEFERKGRLAVIADGMGGYEGGQEASRLAVQTIREVYDNLVQDDPQPPLLEAFVVAHARIQAYAFRHPDLHGMGTTCTALVIRGHQLALAHHVLQGDRHAAAVAVGHHHVVDALRQQLRGLGAHHGAEGPVEGRGHAAALDVAQGGDPGLHPGQGLKMPGQP